MSKLKEQELVWVDQVAKLLNFVVMRKVSRRYLNLSLKWQCFKKCWRKCKKVGDLCFTHNQCFIVLIIHLMLVIYNAQENSLSLSMSALFVHNHFLVKTLLLLVVGTHIMSLVLHMLLLLINFARLLIMGKNLTTIGYQWLEFDPWMKMPWPPWKPNHQCACLGYKNWKTKLTFQVIFCLKLLKLISYAWIANEVTCSRMIMIVLGLSNPINLLGLLWENV